MDKTFLIVTLSGPPASGKTVVKNSLGFRHVTTATTRKPRVNEVDGKDYHFIKSVEEFWRLYHSGEILEKNFFEGNYYGMYKQTLEKIKTTSDVYAVVCEANGVEFLKGYFGNENVLPIFLELPLEAIARRLRDSDRPVSDFQNRLSRAKYELSDEYISYWKKEGHILYNGDTMTLEETVDKVRSLVEQRRIALSQ
jgi:guanylate kinase